MSSLPPGDVITVDIGDLRVTADPGAQLVTYALGSCIAVIVHDPIKKHGGMIHYMLPLSQTNPAKAKERPGMFADVGIPLLFEGMYRLGSRKQDLVVKVAGGGQINDPSGTFEIGKRNYTVLRKMFWKAGVPIAAEDCGGNRSRTARLFVGTGTVTIRSMGQEKEL